MKLRALLYTLLAVSLLGATAEAGRPSRRPRWTSKVREEIRREIDGGAPAEKAIDWMTDFTAATELAGKEDRPLMVLFTTEQLARTSNSCTFRDDAMRRAVHEAKPVPVMVMPPVQLDLRGVPKEEAEKRRLFFEESQKTYSELVKRYRISTGPSLILAAPDASTLKAMVTPADGQIRDALSRLDEMIEAYRKAAGKADPAGDQPKAGDAPKAKPEGPKPPVKKDPGPEDVVDPEDDF